MTSSTVQAPHAHRSIRGGLLLGTAAACLATSIGTVHAEPSLSEIAKEIAALRAENQRILAENRQMKSAISDMRREGRRTSEKVRAVEARRAAPAPAAKGGLQPAMVPVGTVPTFVNSGKQLQYGAITITPGG